MTPREYALAVAATFPALTADQIEAAARILAAEPEDAAA